MVGEGGIEDREKNQSRVRKGGGQKARKGCRVKDGDGGEE